MWWLFSIHQHDPCEAVDAGGRRPSRPCHRECCHRCLQFKGSLDWPRMEGWHRYATRAWLELYASIPCYKCYTMLLLLCHDYTMLWNTSIQPEHDVTGYNMSEYQCCPKQIVKSNVSLPTRKCVWAQVHVQARSEWLHSWRITTRMFSDIGVFWTPMVWGQTVLQYV